MSVTTMKTPDFFDTVPAIVVADPLAKALGAADGGVIDYRSPATRARRWPVPG